MEFAQVNAAGTRTRRQTIGLIPTSQTLICRTSPASAVSGASFTAGGSGFDRRFIAPDYRVRPKPHRS